MPAASESSTGAGAPQWSSEVGVVVVDPEHLLIQIAATVLFLGLIYSLVSAFRVREEGMDAFAIPDRVAATMVFGMALLAAAILLPDLGVFLIDPELLLVKVASIIMFLGLAYSLISFKRVRQRGMDAFAIPDRVAGTMLFGMLLLALGIAL